MRSVEIPARHLGKDYTKQMRKARAQLAAMPDARNKPFTFWLTLPPSVNGMYWTQAKGEDGKTHRRLTPEARRWKREARDIVDAECLQAHWQCTRHSRIIVEITAYWPDDRRKRDMNNLHKALADSMEGIVYHNDQMALLRDMDFHVDPIRPRVELKVYQLEAGS